MQGATEKSQLWYQNFKSFADNTRNNKNNNKKKQEQKTALGSEKFANKD